MTRHTTTHGLAAIATIAILFPSCSDEPETRPGTGDGAPSSSADLVRATRLADVATDDALLTPGLYAMGFSADEPDAPTVVVDVPAGYTGRGDGLEISAEKGGFRHLDIWTVSDVVEQPCGATDWIDPGPSAQDLADALAALPVWDSTTPAPVIIGGYDGVFMELNVPSELPASCPAPQSWREETGGTQGIGPGKSQRLWIVDVDGRRVMLVVGYFPGPDGPSRRLVAEMTTMAESATFVDPDLIAP